MKWFMVAVAAIIVVATGDAVAGSRVTAAAGYECGPTWQRVDLRHDGLIVEGIGGHQHNQVLLDAGH